MTTASHRMGSAFATIILITLTLCCQTAIAQGRPRINTDKATYRYGESIHVYYRNAPGYSRDWITIVRAGARHTQAGNYQYIPRNTNQGVLTFRSPPPGNYEVRAYYNYSAGRYFISARSRFRVTH